MLRKALLCVTISMICAISNAIGQNAPTDTLNKKKYSSSFYPALAYQPETKLQIGGIAFFVKKQSLDSLKPYRPTSFSPYAIYTLNNQVLMALDFDIFNKKGLNFNYKIRAYNYPDVFFGYGNSNDPDKFEWYTNKYVRLNGKALNPINSKLFIGIKYDLQYNKLENFDKNGVLQYGNIYGYKGGWNMGIGPSIVLDSRNSTIYPTKGMYSTAEITFYGKFIGSSYSYINYLLDIRKYYQIKNDKNVMAFQVAAEFNSGGPLPFYKLAKTGGDNRLRGIKNESLYIDNQAMFAQLEYRRWLFWRFGAAVFAGVGDVAPSITDFNFKEFKSIVGVGGRFQALKDEKFNIRIDLGISNTGQKAFYFNVREAF